MAKQLYDPRNRRSSSLGQLDSEFNFGPRPLSNDDVPIDIQERYIRHDKGGESGAPVGPSGFPDFTQLFDDVHSIAGILILRRGLIGRTQVITGTPSLIINNQEEGGRGYLLLNPAGVTGRTTSGTVFSTQTLVGATTLLSASLGVANYNTARFFVVATFNAGAGPVTFDLQTADPVTGTYITSQTIFSLIATGNAYANVGGLGIDVDAKIFVTVPGGTSITFSLGYVLKDGLEGTSAGASQTIFVGQSGVSTISGYPILAGNEKQFYFKENVSLYAVTGGVSLTMNIFEL